MQAKLLSILRCLLSDDVRVRNLPGASHSLQIPINRARKCASFSYKKFL